MSEYELLAKVTDFAKEAFIHDASGHDWPHTDRVRRVGLLLADAEGANRRIVEIAALLHDIADWKIRGGDLTAGPREAKQFLLAVGADEATAEQVAEIIAGVSFKGAGVDTPMRSIEGRCVQDADRLEAIGAIGIARAFAFGGAKGRAMYDPTVLPELHSNFKKYSVNDGHTINHFFEKLLLLRDRMQTASGRSIAKQRHAVLVDFLQQFFTEWHGDESPPIEFSLAGNST